MSGKYVAYPEYKDSGIEWLGDIPEHWSLIKGGYIGCFFGSESISDQEVLEEGFLPFIKVSDLAPDGFLSKNFSFFVSETKAEHCKPEKNYVVFPKRGAAIFANKVNIINIESIIDPNLMGWKIFDIAITEYVAHLLKTRGLRDIADVSTVPQINNKHISPEKFPIPPVGEQQKIANFLDHETAKIDTLIAKQQQLITLLKEKRQAVISHAVTKGLNPNAPMRDSGVEWLGEVPEGWDFCLIKHKCTEITDGAHVSPEMEDGEHYFVSITDIKKGVINFSDALLTSPSSYQYLVKTGCMPFPGDILFSKDGTIGQTAITPENKDFVVASSLIIIRPNREKVRPQYLDFLLQSDVVVEQVESFVKGAALRRLSIQNLLKVGGTFPPIEEQDKISEYLVKTLDQYDELETQASELIVLQQERRTALISAAVTGKIDVRSWQAPEPSSQKETAA